MVNVHLPRAGEQRGELRAASRSDGSGGGKRRVRVRRECSEKASKKCDCEAIGSNFCSKFCPPSVSPSRRRLMRERGKEFSWRDAQQRGEGRQRRAAREHRRRGSRADGVGGESGNPS